MKKLTHTIINLTIRKESKESNRTSLEQKKRVFNSFLKKDKEVPVEYLRK